MDGELWYDWQGSELCRWQRELHAHLCVRVGVSVHVCVFVIFASRTPFPAFPACPPTQHMSSSPLLSSPLIPPVIIHFVVSFLSVFCVGDMHVCALCAPFQWFLMYLYP